MCLAVGRDTKAAKFFAAQRSISSVIFFTSLSNAPRKIPGNPKELFT
jgi:hypothetical protein